MKVVASFIAARRSWAKLAIRILAAMNLLVMSLIVWVYDSFNNELANLPSLEARIDQLLESRKHSLEQSPMPEYYLLGDMRERVAFLNSLSQANGWSTEYMLSRLEEWLPEQAYLVSFQHKRKKGEIDLIVEASRGEYLTGFLLKMEQEAHFSEVLLGRQVNRDSQDGRVMQFEINIKERL